MGWRAWLWRGVKGAAVLMLAFWAALALYVATGPRSLDAFLPYLTARLAPPRGLVRLSIGKAELVWDGWTHPIAVHLERVDIQCQALQQSVATLPDMRVRFHILPLLLGRFELSSLELSGPSVRALQRPDGAISLGFAGAGPGINLPQALAALADEHGENPLASLKELRIDHATLQLQHVSGEVFLQSNDVDLTLVRRHHRLELTLTMQMRFGHALSPLTLHVRLDGRKKTLDAEGEFQHLQSEALAALLPSLPSAQMLHMPLSGRIKVRSDFTGAPQQVAFSLQGGAGSLRWPDQFDAPVTLAGLRLAGTIGKDGEMALLREGVVDAGSFRLLFHGSARRERGQYGLEGEAALAGQVDAAELPRYWPRALSPHTRQWVRERIGKGAVTNASIAVHFKPGELGLKDTPDAAIDANATVTDASVRYLMRHPPVTNGAGTIHFSGNAMQASLTQASYLTGTQASNIHLTMPNLAAPDVKLFVTLDVNAPAKDIATFLALPDMNKAARINLTGSVEGRARGRITLDCIAFSDTPRSEGDSPVNFSFTGELEGVAQPQFLHRYDVRDAAMHMTLNNDAVSVLGHAVVNQTPMRIDATSQFKPPHATRYNVTLALPVTKLPEFHLPVLPFAEGTLSGTADFLDSDSEEQVSADIDLRQTGIHLPEHGVEKAVGEPASLHLETQGLASGNTRVRAFTLTGPSMQAVGEAELQKGSGEFTLLHFTKLRYREDDLESLTYRATPHGLIVSAKGRALDLTSYGNHKHGSHTPDPLKLDIDVDRLIIGHDRELHQVALQADCGAICDQVKMNATLAGGAPFTYRIEKGALVASCPDAGELLRAFDVFDGIKGGALQLAGAYIDGHLAGELTIKDFTLTQAPIMTRILTLGSLTGLVNTIRGTGIAFSKLSAPYVYGNDVAILKEAKAHGSALGVTAQGLVDIGAHRYDLTGALVPSYTLNSLVGNVPLIGNWLVGGEGKGLFALNYQVTGDMSDPSVSVNPLSVLTPGFMRGVFDMFDAPAPDMKTIEAQKRGAASSAKAP